MKTLLVALMIVPVAGAPREQRPSRFAAAVAQQARMEVPGTLNLDQASGSTQRFRVYQIVKPAPRSPLVVFVRLASKIDGEIVCEAAGSGAKFRTAPLTTAWTQIAISEEDVSELSANLTCTATGASERQAFLEWKYQILDF